jgi:hypothetical protein
VVSPGAYVELMARVVALRAQCGQPHWLLIDEAHHLMPANMQRAEEALPERLAGVALLTVQPQAIAARALGWINTVIATGDAAQETLRQFAAVTHQVIEAACAQAALATGEGLLWMREEGARPVRARVYVPDTERRRHQRKYAEGELPPDRSFYFRGPRNELNLRARNLMEFIRMSDGVGDETWEYHRRRGDYSRWMADGIKDDTLASEAQRIESNEELSSELSRVTMRKAIERLYTLPA